MATPGRFQEVGQGLDEAAVQARARALGRVLAGGEVLLLEGPMGAGKTTFTRALAEGLGVLRPARVTSPTFALCLVHPGPRPLVHLDLYRLEPDPLGAGAEALGLESGGLGEVGGAAAVTVVEWPDRWGSPPADHLRIRLDRPAGRPDLRSLAAAASGPASAALLDRWIAAARGGEAT